MSETVSNATSAQAMTEAMALMNDVTFTPLDGASGTSRLEAAMFMPLPRETLFEFFSDAFQLETITPPWLRFKVVTPAPIRITAGTIIDYKLRVHGIPMRWQSRISVWDPPVRFVDEQVRGPYRRWHHEHVFEEADGGTICRDIVDYAPPGGRLIDKLFIRRDLRTIFRYRQQRLMELLGPTENA